MAIANLEGDLMVSQNGMLSDIRLSSSELQFTHRSDSHFDSMVVSEPALLNRVKSN